MRPDSFERYASHRPSGENIGPPSMNGLLRNTRGLPGLPPRDLISVHGQDHQIDVRFGRRLHRTPGTLPLGCHDDGACSCSALRQALGGAGPIGGLPVQIRGPFIRAGGCKRDPATIRCPHGLHGPDGIGRQLRERVPSPLVHPDVGGLVPDLHRESAAIGGEERIDPVRAPDSHGRRRSLPIHPVQRCAGADARPGQIDERAVA